MQIGGLILIALYISALVFPVFTWAAFVFVKLNDKREKTILKKAIFIVSIIATVASISFFVLLFFVFDSFSGTVIEREETKEVSFDNGDSFRINLMITSGGFHPRRFYSVSVYDAKRNERCAYISCRVDGNEGLIDEWDKIELAIKEEDVVCYETPWCVIFRKKGEFMFRSVTTRDYEDYMEYISVYEKVKADG